MAIYENLPAYKASYDLLLEVFVMNINLKRDYRYTLGEKLKTVLTELMVDIYRANSKEENKAKHIHDAIEKVVELKLYIRLLHDLKQIPMKRFVSFCESGENLSKQLNAWHKSSIKKKQL